MTTRGSYSREPALLAGVFELLEHCFEGIGSRVERASRLGLAWGRSSTPFVLEEGGLVVAHVGLLEIPLVIEGRQTLAGGLHAVCTHPRQRGRGHFRRVMQDALAWAAERYETLLLMAGEPGIYERFGFRVVPEYVFVAPADARDPDPSVRSLDFESASDVALLNRLLAQRAPVSRVLGVTREQAIFHFNECTRLLVYSEELEAVISLRVEGSSLLLFDVVGRRVPSLRQIVACVGRPLAEVVIHFSPDQLEVEARPRRHVLYGDELLMVRGPFVSEGTPFMLPPSSRC